MNANVDACFALLGRLKSLGITHCVISPGGRSTPLAYVANQLFEASVVIDERDAGFVALGLSASTGVAPIVITTSGSAPSHLYPAICEAFNSNLGIIVLSADHPHIERAAGGDQTINQVDLFGTHVRYSFDTKLASDISDKSYWFEISDNIFKTVSSDNINCGPAQLNIAFNKVLTPDGDESYSPGSFDIISEEAPEDSERDVGTILKNICIEIESIPNGVITLGRNHYMDISKIQNLSNILDWPIFADGNSNARYIDGVITSYDFMSRQNNFDEIAPSYVLQFGEPLISSTLTKRTNSYKMNVTAFKKFDDGRDPNLNISKSIINNDINFCLDVLIDTLNKNSTGFKNKVLAFQDDARNKIEILLSTNVNSEPNLFSEIGKILGGTSTSHENTRVANSEKRSHPNQSGEPLLNILLGNSMPVRYAERLWTYINSNTRVFSNRGTNGIDGSLSTATGIAIGSNSQTLAVLGDVTFAHDLGFLPHANKFAIKNDLNIIFVVIDNAGGAIFSHLPQSTNEYMKDLYNEIVKTDPEIDFNSVAKSFKCRTGHDLNDLKSALSSNNPGVDVIILKTEHYSGRDIMPLV